MTDAARPIVTIAIVIGGALSLAGAMIWIERRLLALFQDRVGPNRVGPAGLAQPLADVIKLFMKEDWSPRFADRPVFIVAPAIIMMSSLLSLAIIVWMPGAVVADLNIGILFFMAMTAMAVYSVALAGWASNNKYALLGGLRAVAQMLSYEVFMGLSIMGVVLMAGSFRLTDIVEAQRKMWFVVPQFVGFVVFFIAGIAETHRLPFDLPEAENELVAGYHTEYSGMKFAMFLVGEYVGMIMIAATIVTLFFGGWAGPLLPPLAWFLIKTLFFLCVFVWVRATLPRLRSDQLMAFAWKVMLPVSLLNLAVTGAVLLAVG